MACLERKRFAFGNAEFRRNKASRICSRTTFSHIFVIANIVVAYAPCSRSAHVRTGREFIVFEINKPLSRVGNDRNYSQVECFVSINVDSNVTAPCSGSCSRGCYGEFQFFVSGDSNREFGIFDSIVVLSGNFERVAFGSGDRCDSSRSTTCVVAQAERLRRFSANHAEIDNCAIGKNFCFIFDTNLEVWQARIDVEPCTERKSTADVFTNVEKVANTFCDLERARCRNGHIVGFAGG